jgi:hypothetical protein
LSGINNPAVVIGVTAIDTAKDVLAGTDAAVQNTVNQIEQSGNRLTTKFSEVSARFRQNASQILQTTAGLGAGIASFATSFDTINKAQIQADRAALIYRKSLADLNKAHDEGKLSADEFAEKQEQVRLNLEKTKQAQDNLSDTYVNFLANVPAQLISFGVAANGIYSMLRSHQASGSVTAAAHAVTYNGALASMNVANVTTAGTLKTLGAVMKSVFLTNPVFLAIAGIATLIMLVATNTFGLRDAFYNLGRSIYEFFVQYFKPLADAMSWFYQNVLKPIGDFMGREGSQSAQTYSESLEYVAVSTDKAAEATNTYADYLHDVALATEETKDENLKYLMSIGELDKAIGLSNEQIDFMADFMRDESEAAKEARRENFNLVAEIRGIDVASRSSSTQLAQMAANLRELQDQAKGSTTSLKELVAVQEELEAQKRGMTYEQGEFRATGDLADAKDRYAGLEGGLIKIGSNFVPKNLLLAKRAQEAAGNSLRSYERKHGDNGWSRTELERLDELRSNYAESMAAVGREQIIVNNTVNINNGKVDIETEIRDSQNRRSRASSQILAGAG